MKAPAKAGAVEHLFEVEDELHAEVPYAVVNSAGRGGSWMHVSRH
jgi:hypothetical protein